MLFLSALGFYTYGYKPHFILYGAQGIVKKSLVWHSHNFPLPYITVEEYIVFSITFIFNLYFYFVVVDEFPSLINIAPPLA